MDLELKNDFLRLWGKHWGGASLPVTFYYTNDESARSLIQQTRGQTCVIGQLAHVRGGEPLAFDRDAVSCSGGKRYLGFTNMLRPGFEYFLSYGIPGELACHYPHF